MNSAFQLNLGRVIGWSPLLALPLMLNLRWIALVAPNEEPKWFVFVLLALVLAVAGSLLAHASCRNSIKSGGAQSRMSLPRALFICFFMGLGLGVTYAVNFGEGMNRLAFWLSGGTVFIATAWSTRRQESYLTQFQTALSVAALILCAFFWRDYFIDFPKPGFPKFVAFSRIGHFNFTADVLTVLIPMLAWTVMTAPRLIIRLAAIFCLASTAFMLLTSGSIGGMGGVVAGGLVAGTLGITRKFMSPGRIEWRARRRAFLIGAGMVLAVIAAAKPLLEHMPREYREQMFVRAVWWGAPNPQAMQSAKSLPPLASFWMTILPYLGARTPMWASTSGMVAERPWRGFGTGSYLFEYPAFSHRYDLFGDFETFDTTLKTNPHNILLQIASENGLPMMLLFSGLYLWLLFKVMQRAWHEPSAFWLAGVWALWAAGLDAQVNHVFFNPASLFMAATGLGLIYGRLQPVKNWAFSGCRLMRTRLGPLMVMAAASILASYPLRWVVSEHCVADAMWLASGNPPATRQILTSLWDSAYEWSPYNMRAIFGKASLALQQGDTVEGERLLRSFLDIVPNHSHGLSLLANLEASKGNLVSGQQLLEQALRLEPNSESIQKQLAEMKARQGQ